VVYCVARALSTQAGGNPRLSHPLVKWIGFGGVVWCFGTLVVAIAESPCGAGAPLGCPASVGQPVAPGLPLFCHLREGSILKRRAGLLRSPYWLCSRCLSAYCALGAQHLLRARETRLERKSMHVPRVRDARERLVRIREEHSPGCATDAKGDAEKSISTTRRAIPIIILQAFVQENWTQVYTEPPKSGFHPAGLGIAERLSFCGRWRWIFVMPAGKTSRWKRLRRRAAPRYFSLNFGIGPGAGRSLYTPIKGAHALRNCGA